MMSWDLSRAANLAMTGFALLWVLSGLSAVDGTGVTGLAWASLTAVATAAWVVCMPASPSSSDVSLPDDWPRRFNRISILQGVAIVMAVAALVWTGSPGAIPPAVCSIVALHFVPLARLFRQPHFMVTAASLLGVAMAGGVGLVIAGADAALGLVGFGAGGVLWGTVVASLLASDGGRGGGIR
ncbi:MAG: hypothetical protein H0V05_11335 [Euzebyaceae bacterium]|nr:hypothetical protein [Euzebyaceae bacterium]